MESSGNETFDRIQREIQETLQREEELRRKYNHLNNNNHPEPKLNGFKTVPKVEKTTNGVEAPSSRLFTPNVSSKGVMHKFLKTRGKLSIATLKPKLTTQSSWSSEDNFEPAKVVIGSGKAIRNGYVSAEEKMRRELQEFQQREAELRLERKKSQPDLMAALEQEAQDEFTLKPARSMVALYNSDELTDDGSSVSSSLKPARSLAELCDADNDELENRSTHSLIRQFERMKSQ